MLFPLGFTCMFVSLQCFLQHLVQETIWMLVIVKMSAAESFSKTWRYLPDGLIFSNFISILRQILFLLLVCIFLPDFDTLAVVRWIPPILSWDHFISNMGTKVLLHIWIAYLLVFFYFPQSNNGKWALFSLLSYHSSLVVWSLNKSWFSCFGGFLNSWNLNLYVNLSMLRVSKSN